MRMKIVGEGGDLLFREIGNDALGEDEAVPRTYRQLREEYPAFLDLRKVQRDAFQRHARFFMRQQAVLVLDDPGVVDLDPAQRLWKLQAVGPRVESGAEIDHGVDSFRNMLL